jgi:hypothetical protein
MQGLGIEDSEPPELDAVAGDAGLADGGAIGARQVGLVVEAENVTEMPVVLALRPMR